MRNRHDEHCFVAYNAVDLDSPGRAQCLYLTPSGTRCKNRCVESDTREARRLRDAVKSASSDTIDLNILRAYILYNCCNQGQHRRIMSERGPLKLLTLRWRDELLQEPQPLSFGAQRRSDVADTNSWPAPNRLTTIRCSSHTDRPKSNWLHHPNSLDVETGLAQTMKRSSSDQKDCDVSTTAVGTCSSGSQSRYCLRSQRSSTRCESSHVDTSLRVNESGFMPYKDCPRLDQPVMHKLLEPIKPLPSHAAMTGSLYMFRRASSPGYVKIGWTAGCVDKRLRGWACCGYTPIELLRIDEVPHAERAERLIQLELMTERRRERICQGTCSCVKSHTEWFEVEEERAKQILESWAEFMKVVQPYDYKGLNKYLKDEWQEIVKKIRGLSERVTARALMEHYYATKKCRRNDSDSKLEEHGVQAPAAVVDGSGKEEVNPPATRPDTTPTLSNSTLDSGEFQALRPAIEKLVRELVTELMKELVPALMQVCMLRNVSNGSNHSVFVDTA